jgi:hypothetical protein
MIFSLPLDFHIMFTPTEITSIYLKIARSCFFCLRWQKSILFNWNDVKKIYPLTKEGGILGFEVETTRNKLFSKKYPCSQEKEVQDQIAETINLIKRCFPEKFWVERWKRV